jgi:large subunit ribosomal protein L21
MFAVVEIAGTQFEVNPNEIIRVPLLSGEPGTSVEFNNILVAGVGEETKIGAPYISGSVSAKILAHGKDQTVIVFKKKRRKGYQKRNGHRQKFTKIEITNININ